MPNVSLAYVSVYRRMSDIFHTLAYASTIRNSVTGPLAIDYINVKPLYWINERGAHFINFVSLCLVHNEACMMAAFSCRKSEWDFFNINERKSFKLLYENLEINEKDLRTMPNYTTCGLYWTCWVHMIHRYQYSRAELAACVEKIFLCVLSVSYPFPNCRQWYNGTSWGPPSNF
jgi:hypothetical protein